MKNCHVRFRPVGSTIWTAPFYFANPKSCATGTADEYPDPLRSHHSHVHPYTLVRPSGLASSHPAALPFLIAEDDNALRLSTVQLLLTEFPGAPIVACANGRDALHEFDTHGARLVVSNHSMPVMDGPTFVRELRRRSSSLPILMVSGSPEARQEGHAAGISCFLDKDELCSRLAAMVRSLLEDPEHGCAAPRTDLQRAER